MKQRWIAAAAMALVVSLLGVASAIAAGSSESPAPAPETPANVEGAAPDTALDENCESGYVCVWTEGGYHGVKGMTLCSNGGTHPLAGNKFSIKNRCGNKKAQTSNTYVVCVNPGGQSVTLNFSEVTIYGEGSRC